jgi:hypothetical protein
MHLVEIHRARIVDDMHRFLDRDAVLLEQRLVEVAVIMFEAVIDGFPGFFLGKGAPLGKVAHDIVDHGRIKGARVQQRPVEVEERGAAVGLPPDGAPAGRRGPGIVWTALLTPQGKYLADFFVVNTGAQRLIDVKDSFAPGLMKRLAMYRLRADVQLAPLALTVSRGLGDPPEGALADPRHPALGWRRYGGTPGGDPAGDWVAIRRLEGKVERQWGRADTLG